MIGIVGIRKVETCGFTIKYVFGYDVFMKYNNIHKTIYFVCLCCHRVLLTFSPHASVLMPACVFKAHC